MILPSTTKRVPESTTDRSNQRIREQTDQSVQAHIYDNAPELTNRLDELDREWDIERTLEANAALVVLIGVGLGRLVDRRFYALPGLVAGFLLQHAIQGWCPPLPLFRRLGVRTQSEIDEEIYALKAMRGDFAGADPSTLQGSARSTRAIEAVRR